jgi:hypothetical protein
VQRFGSVRWLKFRRPRLKLSNTKYKSMRFEVLTVGTAKTAVLWVVTLCSPVEVYRRLSPMIEVTASSETSVNFYAST